MERRGKSNLKYKEGDIIVFTEKAPDWVKKTYIPGARGIVTKYKDKSYLIMMEDSKEKIYLRVDQIQKSEALAVDIF
jgi:hypothetical protein